MEKFEELYALNVNEKVEKKDGLSYLSWAWAWAEFKKRCPDAEYDILKDEKGRPYFGEDDIGYIVYTWVFDGAKKYYMWLPVLDGANKPMKKNSYSYTVKNKNFKYATKGKDGKYYDKYGNEQTEYVTKTVEPISMFDVNKTLMRCLTKNLAMFGLGLYLYAGEDIPEGSKDDGDDHSEGSKDDGEGSQKDTQKEKKALCDKYGFTAFEKEIAKYEKRLGNVPFEKWDKDTFEVVENDMKERVKKREEAERLKAGLQGISDDDIPFSMHDEE